MEEMEFSGWSIANGWVWGGFLDQIDQDEEAPWARQCRPRSCRKAQKTYVFLLLIGFQFRHAAD